MKKQLFLMSALALTALASCGSKGNQPYTPGNPIKVGLICLHNEGSTYDKNFIDAFKAACDEAKTKGYVSDYEIKTDVPEEGRDCYNAAEEFVHSGCNVVFSDSFGHDVSMHEAAGAFKNVQFSSATGIEARKSGLSNFHNAFASIYEGRYIAGVAAGQWLSEHEDKVTKNPKVGYVGAYPYAEVISGYTSWFLGVQSIVPEATMEVAYTSSWYDPEGERTAAETLIKDKKCVLISQHADSMGAPNACIADEKNPIPNVSYNIDTRKENPKCQGSYLAHSRINWQPYYSKFIEAMYKGEALGGEFEQNWTGTLTTNSVEYNIDETMLKDKTPVENAAKALKEGKLKVFDTSKFTVNELESHYKDKTKAPKKGEDYNIDESGRLTMMKGDTDGDYARDTDLVKKEGETAWIQESTFCSAPSFDFIIDGITVPVIE